MNFGRRGMRCMSRAMALSPTLELRIGQEESDDGIERTVLRTLRTEIGPKWAKFSDHVSS